ncbi:MAG: hypothetical protein ACJ754_05575 [Pyrinomonadaceae bacterium]
MKRQEPTKPATGEPQWYESAARVSTPGGLTKAKPGCVAKAEPGENPDAVGKRRKMRWIVGIYVVVATAAVATGNVFDSIYWAAIALFFAVSLQPRERVPKLLRYFSIAAVLALTAVQVVMLILKIKGH